MNNLTNALTFLMVMNWTSLPSQTFVKSMDDPIFYFNIFNPLEYCPNSYSGYDEVLISSLFGEILKKDSRTYWKPKSNQELNVDDKLILLGIRDTDTMCLDTLDRFQLRLIQDVDLQLIPANTSYHGFLRISDQFHFNLRFRNNYLNIAENLSSLVILSYRFGIYNESDECLQFINVKNNLITNEQIQQIAEFGGNEEFSNNKNYIVIDRVEIRGDCWQGFEENSSFVSDLFWKFDYWYIPR